MKIHTDKLSRDDLFDILFMLQDDGSVGQNVFFWQLDDAGSRSHAAAFELQLGAHDSSGGAEGKSRHYKTRDGNGGNVYAATHDEYGVFLAELFDREPDAKCGKYASQADFREQTGYRF